MAELCLEGSARAEREASGRAGQGGEEREPVMRLRPLRVLAPQASRERQEDRDRDQ
jgi:hypothetical protein